MLLGHTRPRHSARDNIIHSPVWQYNRIPYLRPRMLYPVPRFPEGRPFNGDYRFIRYKPSCDAQNRKTQTRRERVPVEKRYGARHQSHLTPRGPARAQRFLLGPRRSFELAKQAVSERECGQREKHEYGRYNGQLQGRESGDFRAICEKLPYPVDIPAKEHDQAV